MKEGKRRREGDKYLKNVSRMMMKYGKNKEKKKNERMGQRGKKCGKRKERMKQGKM